VSDDPKLEADYLTVEQAAKIIGVGPKVIYTACRRDGLRHTKIKWSRHGKIRIRRAWLDEWMLKKSRVN
jgi:excisionase family DNA binding protein